MATAIQQSKTRANQYWLPLENDLIVDLFAGGGGASTAIELATGRTVDIAINHDPQAISMHTANHPQTQHFCTDIFEIDPLEVTHGRPVSLLWASPDCRHHSIAKGGRPVSQQVRSLAWVVLKWASKAKPAVIMLENVPEFQGWGPLTKDGRPCPERKGETFHLWVGHLQALGYKVDWRELRACDFGTPTSRTRLFLVARCDGQPISWPEPTHGDPASPLVKAKKLKPWQPAASIIDWSIACPSIFNRTKPLKEATLTRIAKGIGKYILNADRPFVVDSAQVAAQVANENDHGSQCLAFLSTYYGHTTTKGEARGSQLTLPMATQTTSNRHALVTLQLQKKSLADRAKAKTVYAFMVKYYGTDQNPQLEQPLHTITTKDRFGLVTVAIDGEQLVITDIGMRMLQPHELYRAMGFPVDYQITHGAAGEKFAKHVQVRLCGNSIAQDPAVMLLKANFPADAMRIAA